LTLHPAVLRAACCQFGDNAILDLFRVISGRRKAKETIRLHADIFKNVQIGLVVLHLEGPDEAQSFRVVDINPAAAEFLGAPKERLLGKTLAVFPEVLKTDLPKQFLEVVQTGKPQDLGEIPHGDELIRQSTYGWKAFPLPNQCLGIALEDVTERKRTEAVLISTARYSLEALEKAKEELEFRVKERTAELQKANEDLQAEIADHRRTEQQLRDSFQQLRALAARLQTVREQERTRIARQIHDELGQALTAIKMDFAYLIARLPDKGKQFQERTNSILKLTDDTMQTVRRIAAELRPGILDDLGLTAAIEWQAQEFQARAGIKCLVNLPEGEISLDRGRSTAIFRIFQETLTNVARHAQATRVDVRLEKGATELILEVRDDGKGIEEGKIQDSSSLGLLGMKERALVLGGTLEVKGRKGEGTTLRVRIPVERRKSARPDQGNAQDPHR
jgi:signal transduction histidine kinase